MSTVRLWFSSESAQCHHSTNTSTVFLARSSAAHCRYNTSHATALYSSLPANVETTHHHSSGPCHHCEQTIIFRKFWPFHSLRKLFGAHSIGKHHQSNIYSFIIKVTALQEISDRGKQTRWIVTFKLTPDLEPISPKTVFPACLAQHSCYEDDLANLR